MSRSVIDVSQFQGNMNEAITATSGVHGVVARAANGLTRDTKFADYALRCVGAGIPFGAYHFLRPDLASAQQHADLMLATCQGKTLTLTTQVDVERQVTEAWVAEYISRLEAGGLPRCSIYLNDWLGVNLAGLADRDVWCPDYVPAADVALASPPPGQWESFALARKPAGPGVPQGWDTWDVWQWSGDGNLQAARYGFTGASASIDLDIVRDAAWERWTGGVCCGG